MWGAQYNLVTSCLTVSLFPAKFGSPEFYGKKMGSFSQKHGPCQKLHGAKNEVFHYEFLQFPSDLVTFDEEILNRNLDFCAVINLSSQEPLTVNPDL